jgi:hypothetical protein
MSHSIEQLIELRKYAEQLEGEEYYDKHYDRLIVVV